MNVLKRIWNALSNFGIHDELLSGEAKRTRLSNRIGFFGAILGIPHIFHYQELGAGYAVFTQSITITGLFLTLFWNHLGYLKFARYWLIILANLSIFFTSSFLGFGSGEHLAYLAVILVIFTFFDLKDRVSLISLISLSFICIFLLDIFDVQLLGEPVIDAEEQAKTYTGNFIVTILISIAIALYFQSLSDKQVDEIVLNAQEELKAIFNNSFDGIFIADLADHRIIETNYRAAELFDLEDHKDLIGRKIYDLMLEPYGEAEMQDINTRLVNNEKWSWEREFKTKQNRIFWGNMAYTFIKYGEKRQLLMRVTDITEGKEFEQKIIFEKERAESAMIAKAHFLNNMSHEIRTPINGVIGLAEIISTEYGEQEEELNMYADLLLESGQRLLRTIGSILDLSNLETFESEISFTQICLNQVVDSTIAEFRNESSEKGITLEFLEKERIYYVKSDLTLLQKVMEHLIGNAVKFTEEGGVNIGIETHQDPTTSETFFDVKIQDTGIGMSKDFIAKKLFMKFEQESEGLDRNYEGSGLGLSLVKRILELLKGEIFVESQQGEGSEFIVRLPAFSASRITK